MDVEVVPRADDLAVDEDLWDIVRGVEDQGADRLHLQRAADHYEQVAVMGEVLVSRVVEVRWERLAEEDDVWLEEGISTLALRTVRHFLQNRPRRCKEGRGKWKET
jgi:hypothetical protein